LVTARDDDDVDDRVSLEALPAPLAPWPQRRASPDGVLRLPVP